MSTNWIEAYSGGNNVRKFQQGGAMAQEAPEAPAQGNDLEAMLAEYAQTRDPQLAVAIADALLEMLAQQQGAQQGAPMARGGMRTSRAPIFKK